MISQPQDSQVELKLDMDSQITVVDVRSTQIASDTKQRMPQANQRHLVAACNL